jgi:hypothetical protein
MSDERYNSDSKLADEMDNGSSSRYLQSITRGHTNFPTAAYMESVIVGLSLLKAAIGRQLTSSRRRCQFFQA